MGTDSILCAEHAPNLRSVNELNTIPALKGFGVCHCYTVIPYL